MGSRLKSLFFGKSGNNNKLLTGQSYDSAVALEPPVKGSYPVAGNGPNVLEEIQRSRAKKEAQRQSSMSRRQSIVSTINIPRRRDDAADRPQTAPHNGKAGGEYTSATNNAPGRTRSGLSMKSPPSFFSGSRRNSIRSNIDVPPPVPRKPIREIQTYQPKKGPTPAPPEPIARDFVPPFAQRQHNRNSSNASHRSHVDILEAHSKISRPRDNSQHRVQASGVSHADILEAQSNIRSPPTQHRVKPSTASHVDLLEAQSNIRGRESPQHQAKASIASHVDVLEAHSNITKPREPSRHRAKASKYGEDVADRNIKDFGERDQHRLDLNSPEFSYLKSVYSPPKKPVAGGSQSRADSPLGHVLGTNSSSDDTTFHKPHGKATSIRSTTAPRTGMVYPPRVDSTSVHSFGTSRGRDDDHSILSNGTHDRTNRALSPLSSTAASIYDEPPPRNPRRKSLGSTTGSSTPARGRITTAANPLPVTPPPPRVTSPVSRQSSSATIVTSKYNQQNMPPNQSNTAPTTNGGTKSRSGSVSYSAFPSSNRREGQASGSPIESASRPESRGGPNERARLITIGAKEPLSLEGVVDLTNTVDADVTTKTLPAVTYEHVTPKCHEIREEVIPREIHTHDVFHRILPVIETEILPPKHYIPSPYGKGLIEIPESKIPGRAMNGSPSRNWKIVQTGMGQADHGAAMHHEQKSRPQSSRSHIAQQYDDQDGADGPVIGLARGEPQSGRSRGNSKSSVHTSKSGSKTKNILEPILSSKKEYITKDGHPKTEYVWRHPPVFETAQGATQPVYIGAGIGDLSGETYYSDDDDIEGAEFSAVRQSGKDEEHLLFRDSGYGSGGALPGLPERSPLAPVGDLGSPREDPKVAENLGEATKGLRRIRERRKNEAASAHVDVKDLEKGVKGLNVR